MNKLEQWGTGREDYVMNVGSITDKIPSPSLTSIQDTIYFATTVTIPNNSSIRQTLTLNKSNTNYFITFVYFSSVDTANHFVGIIAKNSGLVASGYGFYKLKLPLPQGFKLTPNDVFQIEIQNTDINTHDYSYYVFGVSVKNG